MDYFDDVFISFLDMDSIPYIHFQWRDRKIYISNCVPNMNEGLMGLGRHERESLMA